MQENDKIPSARLQKLPVKMLVSFCGEGKKWMETEHLVLSYPTSFLDMSGYVVNLFLSEIEKEKKEPFGIYGPFYQAHEERSHLVFPVKEATAKQILIYDWQPARELYVKKER